MKNIIDNSKLEKLFIANWANFLDQKKLIAYTLECIRNHKFKQTVETGNKLSPNIKITISHFRLKQEGFSVWVEYTVPIKQKIAIGTVELHLSNSGDLNQIQTIGTLFTVK